MEGSGVTQTSGLRNTIGRFFNALPGLLVLALLGVTVVYITFALLRW